MNGPRTLTLAPNARPHRIGPLRRWYQQKLERWLYGRAPDLQPLTLTQRRIYILPTVAGLGFVATLLTMLLVAINYDLALGYAVVFLLAGVGTLGMGQTCRNLAGLTLVPGHADNALAGETLHVTLYARHSRNEPRPALRFNVADDGMACAPVDISLQAAGEVKVTLRITGLQRGPFRLPPIRVESRFPLGLFRTWTIWRPPIAALIYPAPAYPAPALPPLAARGQIRRTTQTRHPWTGEDDFAGLRQRTPADPLRHVAWKIAARRDGIEIATPELLLKHFHGTEAGEQWLSWDDARPECDDHDDPAAGQEACLSILCAWVLAAERRGVPYGLRLPGEDIPPDLGPAHREACLTRLALFGLDTSASAPWDTSAGAAS